jgi:hypothetical protein
MDMGMKEYVKPSIEIHDIQVRDYRSKSRSGEIIKSMEYGFIYNIISKYNSVFEDSLFAILD